MIIYLSHFLTSQIKRNGCKTDAPTFLQLKTKHLSGVQSRVWLSIYSQSSPTNELATGLLRERGLLSVLLNIPFQPR